MDRPRRWPWVLGGGLLVVIAIGFIGLHYYVQREKEDTGTLAVTEKVTPPVAGVWALPTSSEKDSAGMAASAEEGVKLPVATSVLPVTVAEKVVSMPSSSVTALVAEANALLVADQKDVAREKYYEALADRPDNLLRATIEEKLGKLNVEMIRLPWPMAEKQEYVVQTNDAIKFIARKFGTTVEMIVKGNELKRPDMIRPGQRLKVFAGKLEIVVNKSRHDLLLSANGRFFKRYSVATGRYEKTPVGSFIIVDRIPEPPWHRDDGKVIPYGDKENILGTRWMAIKATGATPEIRGYGIHGTWDNTSIGKSESAGCIRLKNEDVEELFEMVPIGTTVTIGD